VRKVSVVPNGVDISAYTPRPARPALRKVITVANLRSEKGHDVLIDAAVDVLHRFPDATFECVGAGPELATLRARAADHGIGQAFTFAGHCEDVPAKLADADIFVLPSRSEAFPNAVLEALAAGLPVIASGTGGILELVDEGRTGLLVPPGEPNLLADAIRHLMSDAALGARLGSAARAHVQSQYSFDRMVASFERVYIGELTRRGVLPAAQPQLAAS
jgi:glycosyltransferase involved in cell wall biosynthesis